MPIAPDVYKKIVTAKVYIDDNFRESIDLDRLSREACLSRYHFHRLFTRIYKVTPHQYLTQKRIGQARRFLAARDLTVTEVCNQVGFESIGSFSLLFKKEMGAAPTSYRDEAWRREQQAIRQPRSELRRSCLGLRRTCFATVRLGRNLRCTRLPSVLFVTFASLGYPPLFF